MSKKNSIPILQSIETLVWRLRDIASVAERLADGVDLLIRPNAQICRQHTLPESLLGLPAMVVHALRHPKRKPGSISFLVSQPILTAEQLVAHTEGDLLTLRQIGPTSIAQIREFLKKQ